MAIDTAADQKVTEHMAQTDPDPDPDPDRTASEVSSAADRDSTTEDLPTIVDGSPSSMEDRVDKENIPEDVVSMLMHEKLQLAQDFCVGLTP